MVLNKSEIDRIGERIATSPTVQKEDLDKLQEMRRAYKEPLALVFNRLSALSRKVDKKSIVTYRIKRINTIIRKLQRFANNTNGTMKLSRMWDIAGCRCIINGDNAKVFKLLKLLTEAYPDHKINNYISTPKPDGYRSIHIYVTEPQSRKKIEIQLRTIEQHNWATLVEIIDLLYDTKIKEGSGNSDLQQFLFLFSKKNNLSKEEKIDILRLEHKYHIFKEISNVFARNYLNVRKQWVTKMKKGNYYVIEADKEFSTSIDSFKEFTAAEEYYYAKYMGNKDSNIVLTYIKDARFEQISIAYSNYILTMHSFFDDYKTFIEDHVIDGIIKTNLFKMWKGLSLYRNNTVIYVKTLKNELDELDKCFSDNTIDKYHKKEWMSSLSREIHNWRESTSKFIKKQSKHLKEKKIYYYAVRLQFYILQHSIKQ